MEKNYLYFNSTGKLASRSLNFFQRGLRILGFYADTLFSSIAKACLLPRQWHKQEGAIIATLLTKVERLPPVKWIEQHGNNNINIDCEIATNGTANSLAVQIPRVFWYSEPRQNV